MHFFIDSQSLPIQAQGQSFGPDISSLTSKYNVTSRFSLANPAKAFACQNGSIIVLQSNASPALVNIILKPSDNSSIDFQSVGYFVYRGVLKNSLFSDSLVIIDDSATNTEIRDRIKNARLTAGPYSANILGYDPSFLPGNTNVESIFNCSVQSNIRSINVKEGEWIANFGNQEIGFEVILEADKYNISLDFVRGQQTTISIGSLSGRAEKAMREKILAFIDPAAFFSMFSSNGFNISTFAGKQKTTSKLKGSQISPIITKFFTKNRVYIDIRSEKGYSYNYYQNYGDTNGNNIKFTTPQIYNTQQWPIVYQDKSQYSDSIFNLRLDDNHFPVFYFQDISLKKNKSKSNFINLKESTAGWTDALVFKTPSLPTFSYYIKGYYFRDVYNPSSPKSVLINKKYYDSAFCPLDLPNLASNNQKDKWVGNPNLNYIREPLQKNGTGNFSYAAYNGAYWDDNRVLFYSKLYKQNLSSEKVFLPSYSKKLKLGGQVIGDNLDILCRQYHKSTSGAIEAINVISVNNYSIGNIHDKESLLAIGITRDELTLIQSASGFSSNHHRYLYIEPTLANPLKDNDDSNGKRFYEYKIFVQGLDDGGNNLLVTPTRTDGSPIMVYSRDNLFFNSKAFSANEQLTSGSGEIEFHIYSDGTIKITDNIDLSLVYPYQKIDYKYRATDTGPLAQICSTVVSSALKRARNPGNDGYVNAPDVSNTSNFTLIATYASGDSESSYLQISTQDIFSKQRGQNRWKKYLNLNKIRFLIYFDENLFTNNVFGFHFTYIKSTLRHYAEPTLAAALLGSLIDTRLSLTSSGFSFKDGSCYPSAEHVNGDASDTIYFTNESDTVAFVKAQNKFGLNLFRIGLHKTSLKSTLNADINLKGKIHQDTANLPNKSTSLHDSHLHSTDVILIKGDKKI